MANALTVRPSSLRFPSFPRETWIAALSLAGIALYIVLRYVLGKGPASYLPPLYVVLLAGGTPLLLGLLRDVVRLQFGSDLLAGTSIATAALLHEYIVGSIVVLMLSGGTALEQFATRRASSILESLSRRMPSVAHRSHAEGIVDILLDEVRVGDALTVFPHELCPVDGVVTEGDGWMDESYLSGEPYQVPKARGSAVLSGAVNGERAMSIKATKLAVDSRYARIMHVMREAETHRPRLRRLADRLGAWYTPLALLVAATGWAVSGNPARFLAVIVIATPCPLLIAIPVAIIGAISLAARRGIVVKNPAMLERIDTCRTVILDKTGTLTFGRPMLTSIECARPDDEHRVLRLAACLEQYSKHPLAAAILAAAKQRGLGLSPVERILEQPGRGLRGSFGPLVVEITGRSAVERQGLEAPASVEGQPTGLESLVYIDGHYAATLRFRDEPRPESQSFVRHLSPRHQIGRVIMLSGDRQAEAELLAARVGIVTTYAGKTPEEKLAIVRAETRTAPTLFIGDGINDAPAMQAATVGLAFGQANEITAEAADAVVLEPSLVKVDELLHVGKRMRVIALQSALGGMALSFVGMAAAVGGHLPPLAGAIAQELIDVAAVLNALRVGFPQRGLADFRS